MSDFPHIDTTQPAAHPDPDQLSAFAEHALPEHEREATLIHLATCGRCREIVALALPPVEAATAAPARARAPRPRKSWFAGWHLWLPTGALAATALLVLTLHLRSTRNQLAPDTTTAAVSAPPALAPEPRPASSAAPPAPAPAPAKPSAIAPAPNSMLKRSPPGLAQPKLTAPTADAIASSDFAQNLPVQSRQDRSDIQVPAAPPTYARQVPGSSAVHGQMSASTPAPASGSAALDGSGNATQQAAPAQNVQSQAAPVPPQVARQPATAMAAPQSVQQTVEVTSDTAAITTEAAASESAKARSRIPMAPSPLPSGLTAASTASAHGQTLALDTAGTLFLSSDAGRHWKLRKSPATERITSLGVALSGEFTLTTAVGEHWSSPNGRSWHRLTALPQ